MKFSRYVVAVLACLLAGSAFANGTVIQLSGTLSVKRADGSTRILSMKSEVIPGDTLETQKGSYAQIKFTDGATITLKPNTQFTVAAYTFVQAKPQEDKAVFALLKGGLRAVSGLISKRGDQDAYEMKTETATIGIRGTIFDVDDCKTGLCKKEGSDATHEAGVYVSVRDGEVRVANSAGALSIGAGQFGFIAANNVLPKLLPADPGIGAIPQSSLVETVTSGGVNKGICD
ncbi:MAG: FecR family protein [Sulfuritalea sp.]|nr:FecR family protein [Sulfuritalea sp.]